MNWWQYLLFPFAIIYDLITRCRNWLYDIGAFRSQSFDEVFVLSVGNLSVGGTGKTPMVEWLIRFGLEQGWKIATLSRGYGRRTKGVCVGSEGSGPTDLGDESFGYLEQFGEEIKVVVAESRVEGMKKIRRSFPEVNVVILDDAFQHRSLKPDYSILLTTYQKPFWRDWVLPAGRLREARHGYKRADCLILTKCPDKDAELSFPNHFQSLKGATRIEYGDPVLCNVEMKPRILAVSGIANNAIFFDHLKNKHKVISEKGYSDHYSYTEEDVCQFIQIVETEDATLMCTYKDYVKLKSYQELQEISWGYIPIEVAFLKGEEELKETLKTRFSLHTNTGMES